MSGKTDGARLGDLLGDALQRPRQDVEPVDLLPPSIADLPTTEAKLRRLAELFGVPYSKLVAEIQSPAGLAEVVRLLWRIPSERRGRGRPPEDDENWRFFISVTVLSKTTGSISEAIRTYASWPGNESFGRKKHKTLRTQYERLREDWAHYCAPSLADLFAEAPPKSST